ncbi:meiosis-specific with OB domain-containing protein [Fundulus heteroclitus]|uniref:meiosis-specific with OB domain-containing protein n=1 Tax=Fundulus heteroclitus TaxID=8078 RepID=UPI00165BB8AC|nr:meiosis-specific with OB domain-containing protein [Fundulus heteroclitus]XP_035987997.1 meiosis-specific with OB domain-containing protein [Fundulus heteroclitus]
MAAQGFISISELHPNFSHPKVLGVIIGKTDVRSFPDRKNVEINRFTFGFTIRDSPDFFINVTAWGTEAYINGLADSFSIGDCVTIESPLVSTKDPEKGDRFCPTTPSLYRLLVTETHSQVCLCADGDASDWLLPLLHLPVKDSRDFYSLGDVVANGQKLEGSVINILAALKQVGDVKQFVTSDGRRGQRLEVKLFDDSVSSFPLISWDREPIQLLQGLLPRETVLFIADAKMSFDSFRSSMVATLSSKSIITVNPDTREASLLFSYAKEMCQSGAVDQDEAPEDPPVESISDVYTVSQLKEKAKEHPQPFFGLTYSFISRLDLDSSVSKVIKTRCGRCRLLVTEDLQTCSNQLCPARDQPLSASTGFDLLVDFTDHTGTLQACSLRGPVAEQTLGCTTEEFTRLTDDQRTALKWRFLLERCKIHVKIVPCARTKSGIRALVLGCQLADPGEVKQHMAQLLQGP